MPELLNIVTTKRSGHHAFIEWIEKGAAGQAGLLNNAPVLSGFEDRLADALDGFAGRTLIVNFEGVGPDVLAMARDVQRNLGLTARTIYFLRDPLNMLASVTARKPTRRLARPFVLRQALAQAACIDAAMADPDAELFFYNRWVTGDGYRARVAERLGIRDPGRLPMARRHAGGSSFGGVRSGIMPNVRDLTDRWRTVQSTGLLAGLHASRHTGPAFDAHLDGRLRDAFGEGDVDPDRAAFWHALRFDERPDRLVPVMLDELVRNRERRMRLEAGSSWVKKRAGLSLFASTVLRSVQRPRFRTAGGGEQHDRPAGPQVFGPAHPRA